MEYLPRGPQYGEKSVIMGPDAIPWNRSLPSTQVTTNQETAPILHERVPDRVNGLRVAGLYATTSSTNLSRFPLTIILRYGDKRAAGVPGVGTPIPGIFTQDIVINPPMFFPVYWVVPPGVEFDVTMHENQLTGAIFGYMAGWYF